MLIGTGKIKLAVAIKKSKFKSRTQNWLLYVAPKIDFFKSRQKLTFKSRAQNWLLKVALKNDI